MLQPPGSGPAPSQLDVDVPGSTTGPASLVASGAGVAEGVADDDEPHAGLTAAAPAATSIAAAVVLTMPLG